MCLVGLSSGFEFLVFWGRASGLRFAINDKRRADIYYIRTTGNETYKERRAKTPHKKTGAMSPDQQRAGGVG